MPITNPSENDLSARETDQIEMILDTARTSDTAGKKIGEIVTGEAIRHKDHEMTEVMTGETIKGNIEALIEGTTGSGPTKRD